MNLNMLSKNVLPLEGEMLLSLDEIAKIYTIPTVVMNSLFFSEYVNKNSIKENTDYYLIPKDIYSVFNITSVRAKEIFISITGFIQISLELIKSTNGDVCQEGCRIKFYIRYSCNVFQNFQSI